MRVRHRYAIDVESDNKLYKIIIENNIKFVPATSKSSIAVIHIYEDHENWQEFKRIADECNLIPITTCEFSKEEYRDANWYSIRTSNCILYPQPEVGYEVTTFDSNTYCSECGSNKNQVSEFRLKGEPKWGKKNFFTLNWIYDQLFINDRVYNQLLNSDLTGFKFLDVRSFKSDNVLSGIKQLQVIDKVRFGLIEDRICFKKIYVCTTCNTKKYIMEGNSQLIFNKEVFDVDVDIVRGSETFGEGLIATHHTYISKKFYNFIKINGWDRELEIKPIKLI